ncbi:ATP-binding cassette domain-containing protein [Aurantimonas sp. Leaf443]|uniref:ABC transporter ATP-binding protein n=1 Tax=Aurantimonas sp. Leaf443 TaxID=1736378 RepID=UPI0006FC3F7C|nr:ATP-binding cassette domain-containing protein [Aurantimonas sp. Leaf443]KQT88302.1 ABC transporter ATP-binding protein [Aurantimonas sp. Leaf443]
MSNRSKPVPPAGAEGPLEIDITAKVYRAADGTLVPAVEGLSFASPARSFTALIGPSGCGKTTTLRIVLGLEPDFTGHVRLPVADGRVAAVFQEPRLLPWRTVEENVRLALPADLSGLDLKPLFQTLGLSEMAARYPGELSLGLARRAALARAFAIQPSLLLLDEPFVSLDEETAGRLRGLLVTVWSARPTTALMVTHNLREAVDLADRIVFLTKRPARVRGVYEIRTPRSERGARWREQTLAAIDREFPGVL